MLLDEANVWNAGYNITSAINMLDFEITAGTAGSMMWPAIAWTRVTLTPGSYHIVDMHGSDSNIIKRQMSFVITVVIMQRANNSLCMV